MSFQWSSKNQAQNGVEDMTLLSKVTDDQITENLKKRIQADLMFTYIGPTLVAVNPYKKLPYFTEKEIDIYHGSAAYEHPPHVYAVADKMFQSMITDEENQCVIISGESGAGKTESAKLIMNYIAAVSGGGGANNTIVDEVKRIILGSNPLLESFGNAKTLRNNNSSRFGKYFEIKFGKSGAPGGGKISNFLLEKSRVVGPGVGERNFHIFYQMTKGANAQEKEQLGMMDPQYFHYLNSSGEYHADGINDVEEFADMKKSIDICQISEADKASIFQIVAGILHLGNVSFIEEGNNAKVADPQTLAFPAYLFGISEEMLDNKLTSRIMTTGGFGKRSSSYNVPMNVQQAQGTRDALSKALYTRLFDWIVQAVNNAMASLAAGLRETAQLSLGVLDIFGFEIFERNGFEQFCINYVNERLQQIFIELTLKSEQEEYQREGIQWTPIEYFNNKVVVDLIESKRPPGIMAVLDDICFTMHAVADGADQTFVQKLDMACSQNKHYQGHQSQFVIQHYAGAVTYSCDGFVEANKDTLFKDLVSLMQSTTSPFIRALFPEEIDDSDRKRPTTVSHKIKGQSQELVETLMRCTPSYVRCIKPNETKRAKDWDAKRVEHQVRYLNLKENIRVRRAGYAYRNTFEKFLRRFAILTKETFPHWPGPTSDGIKHIMSSVHMEPTEWQLGRTKIFIKSPESLFLLEEQRDRKYHTYAKVIQRAYRRWKSRKYFLELRKKAADVMCGRKERKRFSLNREFLGDYLGFLDNPILKNLVGKNTKVVFADRVTKYDRKFKPVTRELLLTESALVIVGTEKEKSGPNKGRLVKVIKQQIPFSEIQGVSMSTKPDDLFVVHVPGQFDLVLENMFKTEFVTVLSEKYQLATHRTLPLTFTDTIKYTVKKTTWQSGGTQEIRFVSDPAHKVAFVKNNGKVTEVRINPGLPMDSRPGQVASSSGPRVANVAAGYGRAPSAAAATSYGGAPAGGGGGVQAAASRFGGGGFALPQVGGGSPAAARKKLPPPPPPKKAALPTCRALYDYEASEADELSFKANDVISIINQDDAGWWQGEVNGRKGLFPANYTEPM
ncbi:amoeboid myosin I-like protein [Fimicolochytrium jonesii]|uniref:amoeboid myosin I-like protein n=1 Tax=Fimicolochytrium jonesii TaxID=1396493 RepID=UPI0022FF3E32|nr:amoeboid myosin I-like protein [Fimicolochytrium jonesii]KAI8818072.1 amoeboid myosin I-like protein [Fimicolochytrium jonesii]